MIALGILTAGAMVAQTAPTPSVQQPSPVQDQSVQNRASVVT
jgi:hypothetical protein